MSGTGGHRRGAEGLLRPRITCGTHPNGCSELRLRNANNLQAAAALMMEPGSRLSAAASQHCQVGRRAEQELSTLERDKGHGGGEKPSATVP